MKTATFRLIDAINCEGLDNNHWGVFENIDSTKSWFGTEEDEQLNGQYICIWVDYDTTLTFLKNELKYAKHRYRVDNGYILLWSV